MIGIKLITFTCDVTEEDRKVKERRADVGGHIPSRIKDRNLIHDSTASAVRAHVAMATIRFVLELKADEASGATFKILGPRVHSAQMKRSFWL